MKTTCDKCIHERVCTAQQKTYVQQWYTDTGCVNYTPHSRCIVLPPNYSDISRAQAGHLAKMVLKSYNLWLRRRDVLNYEGRVDKGVEEHIARIDRCLSRLSPSDAWLLKAFYIDNRDRTDICLEYHYERTKTYRDCSEALGWFAVILIQDLLGEEQ